MKYAKHLKKSTETSPVRWILGGLASITLYFQTNLYDPFNSPKLWILVITAGWLLGYILSFLNIINLSSRLKKITCLVLAFVVFSLISLIFTDVKYIAVFGDAQRRNGLASYISLSIILLTTSVFIRLFNIKRLYNVTFFIGLISAFYAFIQTTGRDFVKWNNPYNNIIGTVGNPNFAAAVMAIMGVVIFSIVFISSFSIYYRVSASLLTASLVGLIYQSGARQGLLSYVLGTSLFLVIWLLGKYRKLGIAAGIFGVFIFIFAVLGMLQIGPLEKLIYKQSVSVRGYYWRAGLEMLTHHPIFGVGLDRYGAYFKQYREVGYPLTYGFDITSSNAHNTFIQFFATGGVFLGLSYLILNAYILKCAINGIKNFTGNNRLLLAGVFSAWVAFHAQSLVSIDNIGISIWGWVLGGSIIGLSISSNLSPGEDRKQFISRQNEINLKRVFISAGVTVITFTLVTFLYRGEINAYNARATFNSQDQAILLKFKELQIKAINTKLIDPSYQVFAASRLIQTGYIDDALSSLKMIYENDPRNIDAIRLLALTYEQLTKIPEAITFRIKLAKLDPWNADNYLELGKDYKFQGDLGNSKVMLNKILSFASNDPIAAKAKTDLAP